ncbi:MAG: flagellar basal body L-ring protein FlgH [Planctomycetes bacterium]|nr:flagellar basal body L-ring protein FlgH [Planctomycetota bacterium]
MNRRRSFVLIAALMLVALGDSLQAGSIWAKRGKTAPTMYADDVARRIGDVLTIRIEEDSKVDNKAKRDLQKDTALSSEFDGKLNIGKVLPTIPAFTMEAQSGNNLKSKADFKDERSFVDQVTVLVLDILPNGNLVVTGTRDRNIAGDIQTIEVSGIVRPSDIAYDNTVKSQQVANFRIVTRNSGISAPYTKPGWLTRIANLIWPW